MSDDLTERLRALKADLPLPHTHLSEEEKVELLLRVGPRQARDIILAKKQLPIARIPFVFNRVDTQDLIDLLQHDFTEPLRDLLEK